MRHVRSVSRGMASGNRRALSARQQPRGNSISSGQMRNALSFQQARGLALRASGNLHLAARSAADVALCGCDISESGSWLQVAHVPTVQVVPHGRQNSETILLEIGSEGPSGAAPSQKCYKSSKACQHALAPRRSIRWQHCLGTTCYCASLQ